MLGLTDEEGTVTSMLPIKSDFVVACPSLQLLPHHRTNVWNQSSTRLIRLRGSTAYFDSLGTYHYSDWESTATVMPCRTTPIVYHHHPLMLSTRLKRNHSWKRRANPSNADVQRQDLNVFLWQWTMGMSQPESCLCRWSRIGSAIRTMQHGHGQANWPRTPQHLQDG